MHFDDKSSFLHFWIVSFQTRQSIARKVITQNGPQDSTTDNEENNKHDPNHHLGDGECIAQTHNTVIIVEIGQDAQNAS